MSVILDTDHCVSILRGRLDVGTYVSKSTPLFTTAITVSELVYGAHKSERSKDHLKQVDLLLEGLRVLPFDKEAGRRCGALKDALRRTGKPLSEPDLQIASIALNHALPLATHNQRHFDRVPRLKLVDWMDQG
jgi:tRNA(fMet)-specific endonuclease VapC